MKGERGPNCVVPHQSSLRYGRFSQPFGLYFITKCLQRPYQFSEPQCDDVIRAFVHARESGWIYLHAFVVMSDHWHALISLQENKGLSETIKAICSRARFAWRGSDGYTWQDGFFDHKVRPGESVVEIVKYIENNPVRRRLTETAEHWRWSSASLEHREGLDREFLRYERWA